jgi:hypothetical protein
MGSPGNSGVGGRGKSVAIYTKHGKRLDNNAIWIDGDCYAGDKVIKIRAIVEGERLARLLYVTDLLADDGKREIEDAIQGVLKKR